jgi:hypothetical protein
MLLLQLLLHPKRMLPMLLRVLMLMLLLKLHMLMLVNTAPTTTKFGPHIISLSHTCDASTYY